MPIPFTCPHCHAQTSVDDKYAGQSGPCASCGQPITVPSAGGVPPAFSPPGRSSSSSGAVIAIVIVAVLGCVLVFGGILVALLLPAVQAAREAARRVQCSNNLKQIAIGMHNYHDTYKTFPAAVLTDEDGQPMRSWRAAILPFIEQQGLFDQYDFDVPWDDPANAFLMSVPLTAYQCPSDSPSSGGFPSCNSNYVMVVGPSTLGGDPNEEVRMRDITDGTSNTIMVIEVGQSGIHWMEPRDVTVEEAVAFLTNPKTSLFRQVHPGGANVAMADGSVRFISETISPAEIRAMLTRDDGQPVRR